MNRPSIYAFFDHNDFITNKYQIIFFSTEVIHPEPSESDSRN